MTVQKSLITGGRGGETLGITDCRWRRTLLATFQILSTVSTRWETSAAPPLVGLATQAQAPSSAVVNCI